MQQQHKTDEAEETCAEKKSNCQDLSLRQRGSKPSVPPADFVQRTCAKKRILLFHSVLFEPLLHVAGKRAAAGIVD